MNIVVDIGNSSIKVGLFEDSVLQDVQRFSDEEDLLTYIEGLEGNTIVSSVRAGDSIPEMLVTKANLILDEYTSLPLSIDYKTPQTLGADRIAAAVGAYLLNPGKTNIVIDAGSAINYELVSADGTYLGGAISPGLEMRYRALNNYTAGLPLVNQRNTPDWIGRSTEECIESGVLHGIYLELKGIIEHYKQRYPDLVITACGGDIELFDSRLKESIFVVPNLVLIGLNGILNYNEDRN